MIIGILPNTSSTETLLNNLSEADFDLKTVSVILKDVKLRNKIAKDAGPFKGVTVANLATKLTGRGVSPADVQAYVDAINNGQVFVAIAPPQGSEAAAQEMLADYNPTLVRTLPQ